MQTVTTTASEYLKSIRLGYYEPVRCISLREKLVMHHKPGHAPVEVLVRISKTENTQTMQPKS